MGIFYIFKKIRRRVTRKRVYAPKGKRAEYLKYKEEARDLVRSRLEYWNQFYNLKIGKIAIRNQKTRWGSCSSKGNLNFSYRIVLLPQKLSDYVIVHELCHLGEFNHSPKFWALVGKTLPDYREARNLLKYQHGRAETR